MIKKFPGGRKTHCIVCRFLEPPASTRPLYCKKKLANLRRHASQANFASNNFSPIHLVLEHFRL